MANPIYGSQFISKMQTPVFMKLHDSGETITKPATLGAVDTMFNGVKSAYTYNFDVAPLLTDYTVTQYFTFSTPQRDIAICGGAGVTAPTNYKKVVAAPGATVAETMANIKAAIDLLDDVSYVATDASTFKLVAVNGGICAAGDKGTSNLTVTMVTAGAGNYAKIGKLVNDMSLSPEQTSVEDSEGGTNKTGVKYAPVFNLMNVNQTSYDAIMSTFDGEAVDLVWYDATDEKLPVFMLRDIPCNAIFDPLGDNSKIAFSMTKTYASKQVANKIIYWTFEDLVI